MKVCFIGDHSDTDKRDAPLVAANGLFNALRRKNISVKYITYFKDGRKYSRFRKIFGKQILEADALRLGIIPMIMYVIVNRPDVLYLLNIEFFYLPLLLLKPVLRYKILYTSHGIAAYENYYFRDLPLIPKLKNKITEYLNYKISNTIISLSEKTARLITYCYKINRSKIKVLDNGITIDGVVMKNNESFSSPNIKLAVVGSISRREKGIGLLIDALSLSEHNIELNVYGEKTDLLRTDRYNNLYVNFHPFVEQKKLLSHLVKNDIFVVPSSYDTFNLSLLEAMNIGMLFISSDRVGLTERFDDNLLKFVYKHYSKDDLLDKLNMVIKLSPEERNFYSDLNHRFSLDFSWDKVSTQYIELFNG